MILADKIIELRKRNGWSQEELADRLDVSRQSVSKWEGALSVPDMNKILKLSEIFGVSTDILLKDELSLSGTEVIYADDETDVIRVSMEEASAYLFYKESQSLKIALGVSLCILSPITMLLLEGAREAKKISWSAPLCEGFGMAVLLLLVAAAVALFVTCGLSGSRYEYLEKEVIDTEYGVDGLVKEKRERYAPIYARQLTIGIILCILAVLPVFVVSAVSNDLFVETAATCFMLAVIALAVFMIVHTCIIKGSMDVLLQEGDYSRKAKLESKRNSPIAIIYWSIALAIFLAYSFLSGDWGRSWIVWPIAGVLYGAVAGIMQILNERE
ncbi:MAG: helix-turn-helix transcriptional regulator [Erysipelotrichaceae bacterium]|nr:helix-turn-helix transcriptional regulator [Erysipelotrichaceae bacterium]